MGRFERSITVIAALILAWIAVLLAFGTLPSRVEAQESGRLVPWMICWALAWVAVLSAAAVAGFLLGGRRAR